MVEKSIEGLAQGVSVSETVPYEMATEKKHSNYCKKVVSRLGLEPRALALKGLIRMLRLEATENDGQSESSPQD